MKVHRVKQIAGFLGTLAVCAGSFAETVPVGASDNGRSVLSISEIEDRLPIRTVEEGLELADMLARISDPNSDAQKADLLADIYRSQNTPESDLVPDRAGPPSPARRLQIVALTLLSRVPTSECSRPVNEVLRQYLLFMREKGNDHPRKRLQLSMAALIDAHIEDQNVRRIAVEYSNAVVLAEWTKGAVDSSAVSI